MIFLVDVELEERLGLSFAYAVHCFLFAALISREKDFVLDRVGKQLDLGIEEKHLALGISLLMLYRPDKS